MAESTARNFSYISMVLGVSGRVRPIDLQMIAETDRAAMLRSYFESNASSVSMHFDGDSLVAGAASTSAPSEPSARVVASPSASASLETVSPSPSDQSPTAQPAMPSALAPLVSGLPDVQVEGAGSASLLGDVTSAYDLPVASPVSEFAEPMSEYAVPASAASLVPQPSSSFVAASMPAPELVSAPEPHMTAADDLAPAPSPFTDARSPADDAGVQAAPAVPPADREPLFEPREMASFDMPASKASGLFWVLPVLFTWLGGLIAFLLVRKTNAKQAQAMLVLGIGLTVAYAALVVVAITFGGVALWSVGSRTVTSPASVVISSTPAATGSPSATVPARKKP